MLQRIGGRRRILMTVDAVGGVWQYAMALARQLSCTGDTIVIAGLGPPPSAEQAAEAHTVSELVWLEAPPDWMATNEIELSRWPEELADVVRDHAIDLVHLNEPGQAIGLSLSCPVVAVSHSCIGTWFAAVRNTVAPPGWGWHVARTRTALAQADLLIAPSASHAGALAACYGFRGRCKVVHNAISLVTTAQTQREEFIFSAGRWWDEGKNGKALDRAAGRARWPVFAAGSLIAPAGNAFAFSNVTPLGALPHGETRALMARCGIYVSPSLYEPFGLAALEAATAATPLVLADIPTYRELWSDAAMFFPPRDPDGLASVLDRLAGDQRLREWLGAAALRRSRSYAPEHQLAAMHAAYEEAVHVQVGRS